MGCQSCSLKSGKELLLVTRLRGEHQALSLTLQTAPCRTHQLGTPLHPPVKAKSE